MLFPLVQGIATVPDDARQAAADLGASRWQIFYEVDLPLSAPGIVIGSLLSFCSCGGCDGGIQAARRADRYRHRG